MIEKLLAGQIPNHILPFLWVHGESEAVYRKMVNVIHDSNISAFCVEARPHKAFCREQWWQDLTVILDEAEKLDMKVWILDDKHFPTGFAAGGVINAPLTLKRRNICRQSIPVKAGSRARLRIGKYIKPNDKYGVIGTILLVYFNEGKLPKKLKLDELLSCTACSGTECLDLGAMIKGGMLDWQVPEGDWSIEICSLTYDSGMHRNYINMLNEDSCRILIDEVYEPHYAKFKSKFGTTIAGFFSDEPELGNGIYLNHYNQLGTDQSLPYSATLAEMLEEKLGKTWKSMLPLLWKNDFNKDEIARVRFIYMDCVTRIVEETFSRQVGQWCRDHRVEYIGHVIEDNNQHARTSTSLGHYFRGLKWQTMAGIDDIGDQVMPNGEDRKHKTLFGYVNDGEFYHYALGKLGTSLGTLNPQMKGRSMCEIFGNYGWTEGVQLEKYLLDHFMVRGINHFVPHAFTCKDYPDKDCPPHFYAMGNNPQYRHFGQLMLYTNRVCSLISKGRLDAKVAILYHGEAEWAGQSMLMQKPARILFDNQIDYSFVPSDVFAEKLFYKTEITDELIINGMKHKLLIVPYSEYITAEAAQGISEFLENLGQVVFIDHLPSGIATGGDLPEIIKTCTVLKLEDLAAYAKTLNLQTAEIYPADDRLRVMHYQGESEIFYFVNEGNQTYSGSVLLPVNGPAYVYDAWQNEAYSLMAKQTDAGLQFDVGIEAYKSLIIVLGALEDRLISKPAAPIGRKISLTAFKRSVCRSIDYPNFSKEKSITSLESYDRTDKKFSGFIRYQTTVELGTFEKVVLEITEASEGVEVFVNGTSAGIQVVPKYLFDVSAWCKTGQNDFVIEVATTLARERGKRQGSTGITGAVNVFVE